jgi:hypothetical protein
MLLLVLAGLAWTRLPDKHAWQVLLSLLMPLVLIACALLLQAGTMRSLLGGDEKRMRFAVSALTLLAWAGVVWVAWAVLDWCDDRIFTWAGYLNSRASASARATVFTYAHLQSWMMIAEWILRWIVVPAKVIPCARASAQWGWRLPWRRVLRLLWNWRWWLAVAIAALVGVAPLAHFFTAEPHGTVSAQVWHVMLKLAGAYVLAVSCWVLLLAWVAVLLNRTAAATKDPGDDALHVVPIGSGPLRSDSVRLPLPESGDDAAGNT